MSFFGKIKDAVFGKKAEAAPAPAPEAAPAPVAEAAPPPAPEPVDIEAVLNAMPGADQLNWASSIVDLMKLVGIDASYENRKALAEEVPLRAVLRDHRGAIAISMLLTWLLTEGFVRRAVATVDNLPRELAPVMVWPWVYMSMS